jgi:hypothetical protein
MFSKGRTIPVFQVKKSFTKNCKYKSVVSINVTTPDNGNTYAIAFYYGVQHLEVEKHLAQIENRKINKHFKTIYQYSVNDNKTKNEIFSGRNDWYIHTQNELLAIKTLVITFIKDYVLMQLEKWNDLFVIRQELESNAQNNIIIYPYENIVGIDLVLGEKEHLKQYISNFQIKNSTMTKEYLDRANSFFEKVESYSKTD